MVEESSCSLTCNKFSLLVKEEPKLFESLVCVVEKKVEVGILVGNIIFGRMIGKREREREKEN